MFLRGATRRHASFPGRPRDGRGTSARRSAEELEPLLRPDEQERRLRERLDALGPVPRAELLHVLMLPDFGSNNLGPT